MSDMSTIILFYWKYPGGQMVLPSANMVVEEKHMCTRHSAHHTYLFITGDPSSVNRVIQQKLMCTKHQSVYLIITGLFHLPTEKCN